MQQQRYCFSALVIVAVAGLPAASQDKAMPRPHLADYDSALRLPTGRVEPIQKAIQGCYR